MSILCITVERLPGIRPCTHKGLHKVTCADHPGFDDNPGVCGGCFPRLADRGFLCQHCFARVEAAYMKWDRFARVISQLDRAVQRDNSGVRTQPNGYVPLPGTALAIDECESYLRSFTHSLEAWVSSEVGARDAVKFASAAESAYRTHEIEEQPTKLRRVRCADCRELSFVRVPPAFALEPITVTCQNEACRKTIREGEIDIHGDEKIVVIARIERGDR